MNKKLLWVLTTIVSMALPHAIMGAAIVEGCSISGDSLSLTDLDITKEEAQQQLLEIAATHPLITKLDIEGICYPPRTFPTLLIKQLDLVELYIVDADFSTAEAMASFAGLAKCQNLQRLWLLCCGLTDIPPEITLCTNLKKIYLSNNDFSNPDIQRKIISIFTHDNFPHLQKLVVIRAQIPQDTIDQLKKQLLPHTIVQNDDLESPLYI